MGVRIPPFAPTTKEYEMKKTQCIKCSRYFSNRGGNYNRHFISCDGTYDSNHIKGKCKHCEEMFDLSDKPSGWMANHSRWCLLNPKRDEYAKNTSHIGVNSMKNPKARKKASEGIKKAHREGKYKHVKHNTFLGKKHSEKTKHLISEKALLSKHRRLQRNIIEYKGIMLDSSWELELAKRLDELQVKWTRPEPIQWIDKKGLSHNYFPDFFLPEYNLYLDPKNPAAVKVQKEKINCLLTQYNNIVIITTLEECKNYTI